MKKVRHKPACTVAEVGFSGYRMLVPHPLDALKDLPVGTALYLNPPAPAFENVNEMLVHFGHTDIREGARKVLMDPPEDDYWEEYIEVPKYVLARIRSALNAPSEPVSESHTESLTEIVARAIMMNRDDGGCKVKNWKSEEEDNPHVAQALRQARAAISIILERGGS